MLDPYIRHQLCNWSIYPIVYVNCNHLTATWESWFLQGNHPKMAEQFRLVKYYDLPRIVYQWQYIPMVFLGSTGARQLPGGGSWNGNPPPRGLGEGRNERRTNAERAVRRNPPKKGWLPVKNCDFTLKKLDFTMKSLNLTMNNWDLPMKKKRFNHEIWGFTH